jgi:hypothetical protein
VACDLSLDAVARQPQAGLGHRELHGHGTDTVAPGMTPGATVTASSIPAWRGAVWARCAYLLMVSLNCWVAWLPSESVTRIAKVYLPATVGIPFSSLG